VIGGDDAKILTTKGTKAANLMLTLCFFVPRPRHCERSEAIQSCVDLDCFAFGSQ
jgi:hypothetical protein